ncbi:hypothetical protein [Hymenobacter siberiensis]|uniref:hypothetical protein n=1 Tax=Hymenobacter siberiensis TaxID=2848396 RepID=UPI001C1E080E|nr:hypothetical protein [Hymenobacter siberiensis]MBU6122238.1 hypothetical protein [Hymenobacter siberiensis]
MSTDLSNLLPLVPIVPETTNWPSVARKALQTKARKGQLEEQINLYLQTLKNLQAFSSNDFVRFAKVNELTEAVAACDSELKNVMRQFLVLIPFSVIKIMREHSQPLRLEDNDGAMDVFYDDEQLGFDVKPVGQSSY